MLKIRPLNMPTIKSGTVVLICRHRAITAVYINHEKKFIVNKKNAL